MVSVSGESGRVDFLEAQMTNEIDRKQHVIGRLTAREVLVRFGGEAHVEHSVAWKEKTSLVASRAGFTRGFLIRCSCGTKLAVAATQENMEALRNVLTSRLS
jgi:hypothetical protein